MEKISKTFSSFSPDSGLMQAYSNPYIYVPCGGCGQSFKLGRKEKNQGGQMEKGLCGACEYNQRSAKIHKNKSEARKRHKRQRPVSAPTTGRRKQVLGCK